MKYIFAIIFIVILSCKKNSYECERWLVQDHCFPKSQNVLCTRDETPRERDVCGDELKLAREGKIKTRLDNEDVTLTTTYLHKVE